MMHTPAATAFHTAGDVYSQLRRNGDASCAMLISTCYSDLCWGYV